MGIFDKLFRIGERKPERVRAVVAFQDENRKVAAKRQSVMLQLAVYKATTTPEQRAREAAEAMSRISRTAMQGE